MFIEIAEYLRCLREHAPAWLVLAPDRMDGRHVMTGVLGCPHCRATYPISDGTARFGEAPPPARAPLPGAEVVQALLGLESPGGLVLLAGSAAMLADALAARMPGVHFVTVNGPPMPVAAHRSAMASPGPLPLRDHVARGLAAGAEALGWMTLADARRVVLPGQRVVVLREDVVAPEGLEPLAAGQGLWVGRRR